MLTVIFVGLIVYLTLLTRLKFRRIKEEEEQFHKIKTLQSSYDVEFSQTLVNNFKA